MRIENLNFKDAIFYSEDEDWDDVDIDELNKKRNDASKVLEDDELDDELDDGFYDDGKTY